ncbi:MAG: AmmeMemoRadiSam system protein B [Oceanipulchritudo sp.]|jgi:AmmeMemoRadiSam system protein B
MHFQDGIRKPAVSGMFYPKDPLRLRGTIEDLLGFQAQSQSQPRSQDRPLPKILIAPHAGYRYSGAVAASAFVQVAGRGTAFKTVLLLGPSHHFDFEGLASCSALAYETPLGEIPLDREGMARLEADAAVRCFDAAHVPEHSLEVELPFLQVAIGDFSLLPLVTGRSSPETVGRVLDRFLGDTKVLIVISTDLSHFHGYSHARELDARTCAAIEGLEEESLSPDRACGHVALAGCLHAARKHRLTVRTLDLRNSGDVTGERDRVVGYGAWAIYQPVSN